MRNFTLLFVCAFLANIVFVTAQENSFSYNKLASYQWLGENEEAPEKLPLNKHFDKFRGVTAFELVDDKYFAFLCAEEQLVKLYDQNNNSFVEDIILGYVPKDFTYGNGKFYFIANMQVIETDMKGNTLNSFPFPSPDLIPYALKAKNGNVYMLTSNQQTFLIATNSVYKGVLVGDDWYLGGGYEGKTELKGANACIVSLKNNGSLVIADTLFTEAEFSSVVVQGVVNNQLILLAEIFDAGTGKYKKELFALKAGDKASAETVALTILPNTKYIHMKRNMLVQNNRLTYFVTSPQAADLYEFALPSNLKSLKKSGKVNFDDLYEEYDFHQHIPATNQSGSMKKSGKMLKSTSNWSITRSGILSNANPYLTHTWAASNRNIWSGSCGGKTVTTPGWVNSGNNTGIPYMWGGGYTIANFDAGLSAAVSQYYNKSAGDRNCNTTFGSAACALGVDCSGFVTRAWGRSEYHLGTGQLGSYSTEYKNNSNKKDYRQLLKGDILLWAGHHVMLVSSLNANGTINVIESRSGDWRVVTDTYNSSDVSSYSPRYYNDVKKFDIRLTSNITVTPNPIIRYSPVEVVVYIKNYGSDDYVGKLACAVHNLDGSYKGDIQVDESVTLKAGQNYKVTFKDVDPKIVAGNYQILIKAFPTGGTWYEVPKGSYTNSKAVTIKDGNGGGNNNSDYCSAKGGNQSYEWIERVKFYGETTLDYTSGKGSGYNDYTSKSFNAKAGQSYQVKLYPGFASGSYNEAWKVWIDANQDGEFSASEEVFAKTSKSTISDNFKVPSNAKTGATRMRVVMSYSSYASSCGNFTYGEVEDYTINIQNGGNTPPAESHDFYITGQTVSSTTLETGEEFKATCYQKYNGTSSSTLYSMVGFYISKKSTFDNSATFLGSLKSGLSTGDKSDKEYDYFNVPSSYSFSSDTYVYIHFVADYDNKFSETSESNVVSVKVKIKGASNNNNSEYCSAKGSNQSFEWINRVKIYGETTLDYTSGKGSGYNDYTSKSFNAKAGKSYQVKLYPGFASGSYKEAWKIWIDANQDGEFSASEEVFAKKSSSTISDYFKVPSNAKTGTTRMRVVMSYSSYASSCGNFTYGEVEDYTINIQNGGNTPPAESHDFYITGQTVSSTTLETGEEFKATCYQKYNGTSSSTLYPNVGFYISKKSGFDNSATFLGSKKSDLSTGDKSDKEYDYFNVPSSYSFSSDTYVYIHFVADYDNKFSETSESNVVSVKVKIKGASNNNNSEYCSAKGSNQSYEWINRAKIYGETTLDYTSGKGSGYNDYTSKSFNAKAGKSYQVKLYPGFASGSYKEAWKIWIDANQDGEFSASEEVFAKKSSSTVSDYFKVPSTAKSGTTRMRVVMSYSSYASSCGNFSYGEVEDYTINIQGGGGGNDQPEPTSYCSVKGGNQSYEWINRVKVYGESMLDYTSGKGSGYSNFTSKTFSATVGKSYQVKLYPGFASGSYKEAWKIWIDANQDGEFAASEEVFAKKSSGTISGYFQVPSNAKSGATRMRVVMNYSSYASSCGNFSYGEAEDYTINISSSYKKSLQLTGIEDIADVECKLYPNPASEQLNIEISTVDVLQIDLINVNGQKVKTLSVPELKNEYTIDVANLTDGLYMVRITTAFGILNKKVAVFH